MNRFALILFSLTLSTAALACEIGDTELGDDAVMTKIATEDYKLTRTEYDTLEAFAGGDNFDGCENNVELQTVQMKSSGNVFKVIASTDHACDGDNVIGAVLSEDMSEVLATVSDSFIGCVKPRAHQR